MHQYVFSDEAGDFTFTRQPNVSRYFIICTLRTNTLEIGQALANLRHDLIRREAPVGDCFHATTDAQVVRDAVYAELGRHEFSFQATICEKAKAQPQVSANKARFYKYPWFYHFKHGIAPKLSRGDDLMVTAASIGSKRERETYTGALRDVVGQSAGAIEWSVDFRPALADPMLQAADYCAWALQRKWERNDTRALDPIRDRLTYEYELWRRGTTLYY